MCIQKYFLDVVRKSLLKSRQNRSEKMRNAVAVLLWCYGVGMAAEVCREFLNRLL